MSRRHHSRSPKPEDTTEERRKESHHSDGEKRKRNQESPDVSSRNEREGKARGHYRHRHSDNEKDSKDFEQRRRDKTGVKSEIKMLRDETKKSTDGRDRSSENGRRRETEDRRLNQSGSDSGSKMSNGEVYRSNNHVERDRNRRSLEQAADKEKRRDRRRHDDRDDERRYGSDQDRGEKANYLDEKRDHSRDHRPVRRASPERIRSTRESSRDRSRERRRIDGDQEAGRRRDDREYGKNAERRDKSREVGSTLSQEHKRERRKSDEDRRGDEEERAKGGGKQSRNETMPGIEGVEDNEDANYLKTKRAKVEDTLATRTGGAYIPPARLRMMQEQISDKASLQYQRMSWEALKKSINGLINKANVSNLVYVVRELFQENIVRGRGLLVRSLMQAQAASPTFTHVYAALVAVINTKFPQIGELIIKRLIIQFRKGYRRNDKNLCMAASRFVAHLVNQKVAHEVLSLEMLHILLENPSNDSVELAIGFLKECGQRLTEVSPKGITAVFERLRVILHEAQIDKRVQYMIEVMYAVRKDGFKDHPSVVEELDIVEEDDQVTHMLALENGDNPEDVLNVFKLDPNFLENEEKYKELKKEILGETSSDEEGDEDESGSDDDESDEEDSAEEGEKKNAVIIDSTETNLVSLRRTIYLTIQSSLDFEECAHKLIKMQLKPGQEDELCSMVLDCCAQQRTFEKFFGLLAQRFCMIDRKYVAPFQRMFADQYNFIHRLETNKLRNVSKLFAHLLHTDAISWEVLQCIKLNEDDTTSSSRIFIKILFQELCEFMGLTKLNDRLKDQTLQPFFEGLFPRDNPRNTRFSINFFTSIGLGGLTDELRAHLKSMPRPVPQLAAKSSSSSSSDSSSDDSSSDSSDSSDSDSSDKEVGRPAKLSQYLQAESKNSKHSGDEVEKRSNGKHQKKNNKAHVAKEGHHRSRGDDIGRDQQVRSKVADSDDGEKQNSRHGLDRMQSKGRDPRVRSKGDVGSEDERRKGRHGSDRHRRRSKADDDDMSDEENRHGRRSENTGGVWPKTREDEHREKAALIRAREQDLERAQRKLLELANYGTDAGEGPQTGSANRQRTDEGPRGGTTRKRKHKRDVDSASPVPTRKDRKHRHSRSPGRKHR